MPSQQGQEPQRQPVHSDADFDHPDHPFALVTNVPLIEMTPANGSTEIWLGTHKFDVSAQDGAHGDRASGRIKKKLLDERNVICAPQQPIIPKGSLVVRDLRLWHAGMPNYTDQVRIMLALIHFAPWYRNTMRLQLGDDIHPILDSLDNQKKLGVQAVADWISRNEAMDSYLNRGFGNSYNFSQDP